MLAILGIVGTFGLANAHPVGWHGGWCCPCMYWTEQTTVGNVSLENCKLIPVNVWWGTMYLIVNEDNVVIGKLWQKVDLREVKVGEPFGWHAPLIYNGTVVGFVWIG